MAVQQFRIPSAVICKFITHNPRPCGWVGKPKPLKEVNEFRWNSNLSPRNLVQHIKLNGFGQIQTHNHLSLFTKSPSLPTF